MKTSRFSLYFLLHPPLIAIKLQQTTETRPDYRLDDPVDAPMKFRISRYRHAIIKTMEKIRLPRLHSSPTRANTGDRTFTPFLTEKETQKINKIRPAKEITKLNSLIAIVFFAFWGNAYSYDLLQAYHDAEIHDEQFRVANDQYAADLEKENQGKSRLLPEIYADTHIYQENYEQSAPYIDRYPYKDRGAAVSILQPIVHVDRWIAISEDEILTQISENNLRSSRADLIIRVAKLYLDFLNSEYSVSLTEDEKIAAEWTLAQADSQFKMGVAPITDVRDAQAQLHLMTSNETTARGEMEKTKLTLELVTGTPVDSLPDLYINYQWHALFPGTIEEWITKSNNYNYSIIDARLKNRLAEMETRKIRTANLPTMDLVGSIDRSETTGSSVVVNQPATRATNYQVGIRLTIPLYEGNLTQYRVREAEKLEQKANDVVILTQQQTETSVRQAFIDTSAAPDKIDSLATAKQSAQSALNANRRGFEIGIKTAADLLTSQAHLTSVRQELRRSFSDAIIDSLKLKQLSGSLNESDIVVVNSLLATFSTRE